MNALEMPDHLPPTESATIQRSECLSLLRSMQNADGGWGFHAGGESRVEPTSWAALALFHSDQQEHQDAFRKLTSYLHSKQLADGSWAATPEMSSGGWVTSLACSALAGGAWSYKNFRAGVQWIWEG